MAAQAKPINTAHSRAEKQKGGSGKETKLNSANVFFGRLPSNEPSWNRQSPATVASTLFKSLRAP